MCMIVLDISPLICISTNTSLVKRSVIDSSISIPHKRCPFLDRENLRCPGWCLLKRFIGIIAKGFILRSTRHADATAETQCSCRLLPYFPQGRLRLRIVGIRAWDVFDAPTCLMEEIIALEHDVVLIVSAKDVRIMEAVERSQRCIAKPKEGHSTESPVIFVDVVSLMNDVGIVTNVKGIQRARGREGYSFYKS